MYTYKVTTAFQADWENLFTALFPNTQHSASAIDGNEATFTFTSPQTPVNLGPLVIVELLPTP